VPTHDLSLACMCSGMAQPLPQSYQGMTENNLTGELVPGFNVVEHLLPAAAHPFKAPVCVFVVDVCGGSGSIAQLKVWFDLRDACLCTSNFPCVHCSEPWLVWTGVGR
jgi:hypothetical protein